MDSPEPEAKPLRVTALISSLQSGGAERVMVLLANAWVDRGWSVTVLDYASAHERPFFELDRRVVERRLDLVRTSRFAWEALFWNAKRIATLRREIRRSRPDLVLSFTAHNNVLAVLCTARLNVPVVVSERSTGNAALLSRPWRLLRRLTYPRSAGVVALSRAALAELGKARGSSSYVIPNPVLPPLSRASTRPDPNLIVSIGRLAPVKGFDRLLRAFSIVAGRHPELRLVIWGEGQERANLEMLRDSLGLATSVSLPGRTSDPTGELSKASLFVVSSRWESFSNVILEAMSCGLAVVSFDCESGPREIIRDGIDGLLVPPGNTEALASAMERLMTDRQLRQALAARASDVLKRFSLGSVLARWDDVFGAALGRSVEPLATAEASEPK